MDQDKSDSLSYRDAGVDIDAGNSLVERIKPIVKATFRPGVMAGLGGFGALFELPLDRYKEPVLVSGTDGVGTKLKLALELEKHDTIGIDLVAMCVNDIIVTRRRTALLPRLLRYRQIGCRYRYRRGQGHSRGMQAVRCRSHRW